MGNFKITQTQTNLRFDTVYNSLLSLDYLKNNLPHIKLVSGQATSLMWLDISYYQMPSDVFAKKLRDETGLFINDGLHYGKNGGAFIRMNIATSLDNLKDGLNRLSQFVKGK